MDTSIATFLRQTGAVELLCITDRMGFNGRFTDLNEEINVSHSTLAKRLDEAQELGLITVDINPSSRSPEPVYQTTTIGTRIRLEMRTLGLHRTYDKLRSVEELFAEGCEELVAWAEELDEEVAKKTDNEGLERRPIDEEIHNEILGGVEHVRDQHYTDPRPDRQP